MSNEFLTPLRLAFIPNAYKPPHLGHMYHLVVLLGVLHHLQNVRASLTVRRMAQLPKVAPSVLLLVDRPRHQALDRYVQQYVRCLEYLGNGPTNVLYVHEVVSARRYVELLYSRPAASDVELRDALEHEGFAEKLTCLDALNIRHVVRGKELGHLAEIERPLAAMCRVRTPRVIYHQSLLAEDLTRIGDDARGVTPEAGTYDVEQVPPNMPALELVTWMLRHTGLLADGDSAPITLADAFGIAYIGGKRAVQLPAQVISSGWLKELKYG